MRYEQASYWLAIKEDTQVVLFEAHLPKDVRHAVLQAYANAGYKVSQHTIQRPHQ